MSETAEKTKPVAAAPAEIKTEKKRAVVVDPQRMQSAEYVRREWVCTAEEGTTADDVIDPGYWAHIAAQLTIYDRIEVRVDTGEYLLELLVKDVGRNWAQVAVLHHHDLAGKVKTGQAMEAEFEALFKGPQRKWCVIRKSDAKVLEERLADKTAALAWISNYESTILAR